MMTSVGLLFCLTFDGETAPVWAPSEWPSPSEMKKIEQVLNSGSESDETLPESDETFAKPIAPAGLQNAKPSAAQPQRQPKPQRRRSATDDRQMITSTRSIRGQGSRGELTDYFLFSREVDYRRCRV